MPQYGAELGLFVGMSAGFRALRMGLEDGEEASHHFPMDTFSMHAALQEAGRAV